VSINHDVSHYIYILMHTINLSSLRQMGVYIRNNCSDLWLTDRRVFSDTHWDIFNSQEIDPEYDEVIKFMPSLTESEGALTYRLQGKHVKSDNQNESTYTLLFVSWKLEGYKNLRACWRLIECDKQTKWNETKLEEYCKKYVSQPCAYADPINNTWLIHDGTVLMIEIIWFGGPHIYISEGIENEHTRRPERIDSKM
jgi:hypothetical protein